MQSAHHAIRPRTLDALMVNDFYAINAALRTGGALTPSCGGYLDYDGWGSWQEVADAVALLFSELARAGALGTHARQQCYRGLTITKSQLDEFAHFRRIWDPGYGFGTPIREEAIVHLDTDDLSIKRVWTAPEDQAPVLLTITAGTTSLYIPGPDEADPFNLRAGYFTSQLVNGQYIFDRHALFTITSITKTGPITEICCAQTM